MKRQVGPVILLFTVLGLFGGFAWFSRHPDSPWLEEAQEWPLVGELARQFRRAYLGPQAAGDESAGEGGAATGAGGAPRPASDHRVVEVPSEPIHLPPSAIRPGVAPPPPVMTETAPDPPPEAAIVPLPGPVLRRRPTPEPRFQYVALDWVWFLPGQRIRAAADHQAEIVAELEAMAHLPVLAREGLWAEVVFRDRRVFIDTSQKPTHPRKGARRGLLRHRAEPIRPNDAVKLRKARKILGIERPSVKLGAYKLYTDVDDEELLAFLDSAAERAEDAYFARYGRLPAGNPQRSVVLFAKESSYRRYSEEAAKLPGDGDWSAGHAGQGVLAFYAEGRSRESLARTLVHEIAHLLNDRALARNLPSWLEEGIAGDLGSLWVEDPLAVAREGRRDRGFNLTIQGPESRLLELEPYFESGKLPSLAVLLNLDREKFYQGEVRSYAYAHSFAFIRFLASGGGERFADGFLSFLKKIASGFEANLLKELDVSGDELEQAFRAWLEAELRESRDRIEQRLSKQLSR